MKLIKVPENRTEMLQEFVDTSAFTFEGIDLTDKKGLKLFEELARENGYKEPEMICYWFKGSFMNEVFGLTGDNAYSDSLTFLVVPNFYHIGIKLGLGARWFDDIVANNSIRQNAINSGQEPDYN
jgi:hypothetical protein